MAKARGEVKLGEYTLRFPTNALVELEESLNQPLGLLITKMSRGRVSIKELRAFVWAGLMHEMPDIVLEKAGEIIDEVSIPSASEAVVEAINLAFPTKKKGNKEEGEKSGNPPKNPNPGIGTNSAARQ